MINILVSVITAFIAGALLTRWLGKPAFTSVISNAYDPHQPLPERVVSWTILWSRGNLKEIAAAATVTNGLLAGILAALILQLLHF